MVKEYIYVNHSYIDIPNYNMGDCEMLENILSYWDKDRFKREYIGLYYDKDNKILRIPRGIDIDYVSYLLNRELVINRKSNETSFNNINLTALPRDDDQRMSISFLLGEEDFRYTREHSQLLLNLETGYGKTYCTIAMSSIVRHKIIVLVDELKLIENWKIELLKYTDLKESDIGIIQGSSSINKILKSNKEPNYKIYLGSIKTLNSYGNRNGFDKISELFRKIKVGTKIYDEAHSCFGIIVKLDCNTEVNKTIYLTATAGRSDYREDKIFKTVFKNVPSFGKELFTEEDRYIKTKIFKFNSNPTYKDIAKCQTRGHGFDTRTYLDYSLNKPREVKPKITFSNNIISNINNMKYLLVKNKRSRNNMVDIILDIVENLIDKDGKIAILLSKNEQILKLKDILIDELYMKESDIGIFTQLIPDMKERQKELDKKIILTTEKSFYKGSNVPSLRICINTLAYRSDITGSQVMGRLRYNDTFDVEYIELIDTGFKSTVERYDSRKKVLKFKSKEIKEYILSK